MKKKRTDVSERDTFIILGLLISGRRSVTWIGKQRYGLAVTKQLAACWASPRCSRLARLRLVRRLEEPHRRGRGEWVYYELTKEGRALFKAAYKVKKVCRVGDSYQLVDRGNDDDLD